MDTASQVCIAEIMAAHGIQGAVKIRLFTNNLSLFKNQLFTDLKNLHEVNVKLQKNCGTYWLAKINDISDRTTAETLRAAKIYCAREELPALHSDQFYINDLKGLEVRDQSGLTIGSVLSVQNFGAEDLLEIRPHEGPTYYLPIRKDLIPEINVSQRYLVSTAGKEWIDP